MAINKKIELTIPINSSFIEHAGYKNGHLIIYMKNGKVYKYYDVKDRVVFDFAHSVSSGNYFNRYIKDKYNCEELSNN